MSFYGRIIKHNIFLHSNLCMVITHQPLSILALDSWKPIPVDTDVPPPYRSHRIGTKACCLTVLRTVVRRLADTKSNPPAAFVSCNQSDRLSRIAMFWDWNATVGDKLPFEEYHSRTHNTYKKKSLIYLTALWLLFTITWHNCSGPL